MCVCVCVCVRACVRACLRACVRACVRVHTAATFLFYFNIMMMNWTHYVA